VVHKNIEELGTVYNHGSQPPKINLIKFDGLYNHWFFTGFFHETRRFFEAFEITQTRNYFILNSLKLKSCFTKSNTRPTLVQSLYECWPVFKLLVRSKLNPMVLYGRSSPWVRQVSLRLNPKCLQKLRVN
jgi:hypothetical protein